MKTINITKKGAEQDAPAKKAKGAKSLTSKNLEKASKEVKDQKTKYRYPEDVVTPTQKKEFRRKARAAYKALNATVNRLTKSNKEEDAKELKKAQKEFESFKGTTYYAPESLS